MNPSKRIKVRVEEVQYGNKTLLMALDAQGNLYVTYPAVESILNYEPDNCRKKLASKSLESFLGKEIIVGKFTGVVVNKDGAGTPVVSMISYNLFLGLCQWEAIVNQNLEVGKMLAIGLGDSLRSIAFDKFGIKLDIEERQAWLKSRMEGMVERSALTDAIKAYQEEKGTYGTDPLEFAICSDIVNREILGMVAKAARVHYAVPDKELLRDYLPDDKLKQIKFIENLAAKLIAKGNLPAAATKQAIALLN